MDLAGLLHALKPALREAGRLIFLDPASRIVFVGDTHGDLDATTRVFTRYLDAQTTIVFLGDTVDRGRDSRGNLRLILETKVSHPDRVHLLMGNHEAYAVEAFRPADFWENLSAEEGTSVAEGLLDLPFAAWRPEGLLAVHAGLPDLRNLDAFRTIALGSAAWRDLTWADWTEQPNAGPGVIPATGRPRYGRSTFETRAACLGIRVLVRSHQPDAPQLLFHDRCLTLFTSSAYGGHRRIVAVADGDRSISSARDLDIEEI